MINCYIDADCNYLKVNDTTYIVKCIKCIRFTFENDILTLTNLYTKNIIALSHIDDWHIQKGDVVYTPLQNKSTIFSILSSLFQDCCNGSSPNTCPPAFDEVIQNNEDTRYFPDGTDQISIILSSSFDGIFQYRRLYVWNGIKWGLILEAKTTYENSFDQVNCTNSDITNWEINVNDEGWGDKPILNNETEKLNVKFRNKNTLCIYTPSIYEEIP